MMSLIRNFSVRSGVLLVALLLTYAFAGAGSAAAPLGQPATGTITGQVLSLDDVPLPNVLLAAFNTEPSKDVTPVIEFASDAQGQYSIQVPPGTIWVTFLTQDIGGESFWGYSNLPVTVAAGQTVTGQDFRVAIRVLPATPTAATPTVEPVPMPTAAPPPGMPTTGAGPDLLLPLAVGLGLLLLLAGLAQRRRAPR